MPMAMTMQKKVKIMKMKINNNKILKFDLKGIAIAKKNRKMDEINNNNERMKSILNKAASNIPDCDVKYIRDFFEKEKSLYGKERNEAESLIKNDDHLRVMLALNRLQNPICDTCCKKGPDVELRICSRCCLTFFCSPECLEKGRDVHMLRCCRVKDGVLDNGPMRIAIVKVDKE